MTRKHLTAAVAVTLIALSAPAAEAGKPERVRLPPFESFVDPPGAACPEAIAPEGILWEDAGGNAAATFYEDGTFALRGRHPDRVTNVATGTSVLMKLQGSVVTTPLPDGASETA